MAQRFYKALAQALSAGATSDPHRTIEWTKIKGIARKFGYVGSDKDAPDTLKTTVWLNSHNRARVSDSMARFSFINA